MYKEHFGFTEEPFGTTPDPRFFYENPSYREAYRHLLWGLTERRGLMTLIGAVGTGKTTILRHLVARSKPAVRCIVAEYPPSSFDELLTFTCRELGVQRSDRGGRLDQVTALKQALLDSHADNVTIALLLDEAQQLPEEALEGVRLLSNLESGGEKALQTVLAGQPELHGNLDRPSLAPLKQRIAFWGRLDRLKHGEIAAYIEYRLRVAGYRGPTLFGPQAVEAIGFYSGGVPRLINVLCSDALVAAHRTSQRLVSPDIIVETARALHIGPAFDFTPSPPHVPDAPPPRPAPPVPEPVRHDRPPVRSGEGLHTVQRTTPPPLPRRPGRRKAKRGWFGVAVAVPSRPLQAPSVSLPSRPTVLAKRAKSAGARRGTRSRRRAVALGLGTLSLFAAVFVVDLYLGLTDRSVEVTPFPLSDEAATGHPPAPVVASNPEPPPPVPTAPEPGFASPVLDSPESRGVEQLAPPPIPPRHETSQQAAEHPRPESGSTPAPAVGDATTSSGPPVTLPTPPAVADYPTKPVQLMVAYPPGGSTDVAARIVAAIAEKELGQTLVVVNKTGADGQVGWTEMARQKPDGYHIGFINLPGTNTVILDPARKAAFGLDAFTPIINQVLDPGVIWVKADSRYRSLVDVIEAANMSPNKISVATTGSLSDDHLATLMVEESAGVVFRIVHFKGGAPMRTAILGGHVEVAFDNVSSIVKRVKSREVRALAVMDTQRSKFLPDVPTTVELGFPSVISSSTRGIAGPKGLPEPVVKKLQDVFQKAMEHPDHVKRVEKAGLAVKVMVGDDYAKYYRDLHAKAAKYTELARSRPGRRPEPSA
jgi:tripartite-type tricarboxylate transporter receptor subunit TctC/type II secretory pathway predicted ATPase ExeA